MCPKTNNWKVEQFLSLEPAMYYLNVNAFSWYNILHVLNGTQRIHIEAVTVVSYSI